MTSPLTLRDGDVTLTLATEADNAELCALFRAVHLKADLDLTQERDPDFFALHRLHQGPALTFVARDRGGQLVASGAAALRDAWLDNSRIRVGYLCDLRSAPGFRGGFSLIRRYAEVLDWLGNAHDTQLYTSVIFDQNAPAKKVLLGPGAARRGQPSYAPMTPFEMVSVQSALPARRPSRRIRRTQPADLDALQSFLDARGRSKPLGEDFSGELLTQRLQRWPNFSLSSFYLALSPAGRIIGCLAPWDTEPVKRTRVLGYYGPMATLKRSFNLGAALLRYPALPEPGECLRFQFLTHLEVDDPAVLNDLLRAVYADQRAAGLHFSALMVPRGSPLNAGLGGFFVQRTAMTLYSIANPAGPYASRSFPSLNPGFEMALT